MKHQCPHCGELGISELRRMCLGPALPTSCRICGKRVGVPWWSMAMALPVFIALGLATFIEGSAVVSFWIGGLGVLGMCVLWASFVPLIKR